LRRSPQAKVDSRSGSGPNLNGGPATCIVKFIPLDTPAVTMPNNAVTGDVINRNRTGSGFAPIVS